MPPTVGLWRVNGGVPVRVTPGGVPLEAQLEQIIEADPTILGAPLLLIGRQVPTDYGKFIDLLAPMTRAHCTSWSSSGTGRRVKSSHSCSTTGRGYNGWTTPPSVSSTAATSPRRPQMAFCERLADWRRTRCGPTSPVLSLPGRGRARWSFSAFASCRAVPPSPVSSLRPWLTGSCRRARRSSTWESLSGPVTYPPASRSRSTVSEWR